MLKVINTIVLSIIQVISCTYIVKTLLDRKIEFINFKNILILIVLTAIIYILMIYELGMYKPIIIYLVFIVVYKYVFSISFNESVICNFISMILNVFGEAIIGGLIIIFKVPDNIIYKYLSNTPLSNLLVFLAILIILKLFKKYILGLKKIITSEKINYVFYFIAAMAIAMMLSKNIGNWKINFDFIINMSILVVYVIIVISFFREKYKAYKKTEEFNDMYKQVESVKTLLNRYKKFNHENKNQLLVIRENSKGNDKVIKYIDSILEENNGHKDKWISELSYITDPGISGFLSVKINHMLDNNINLNLTISPKVKSFDFSNMSSEEYKDLCRIIGVYLDNACEASINTKKKEVTIEMLIESKSLLFIISNSFCGELDLDKIDKEGYTTKGKNHGVGLSLVKDIITTSNKFEQKREIIKDYFYQYLYIKK